MKSPKGKKKVVKIKAWAVVRGKGVGTIETSTHAEFLIFPRKWYSNASIQEWKESHLYDKHRVVPCTITYTLPPKKK